MFFYRQLHIAIINGFLEVVYSLIRLAPHPCLLDIVNDMSQSPLHLAVLTNQPIIVRRLVAAGARTQTRDLAGNTPLHLAVLRGDLESAKALTTVVNNEEVEGLGLCYQPMIRGTIDLEQRNYDGKQLFNFCLFPTAIINFRTLVIRVGEISFMRNN